MSAGTSRSTLGARLKQQRKTLGVSATATAEAAGISRVTLHRLERDEDSVALRALIATARVLGLQLSLASPTDATPAAQAQLPLDIRLQDYPQLRQLAWQVSDARHSLAPHEALALYTREWRHVDVDALTDGERMLLRALAKTFGQPVLDPRV